MTLKTPEVKYSDPEHNAYLHEKINTHAKVMYQRGFYPRPIAVEALERAYSLIVMHNEEAAHRRGSRSRSLNAGWEYLKQADLIQGKDFGCMDGRDDEGVNVDKVTESWRLPGGQVTVRDRKSGKILEPHEIPDANFDDLVVVSPVVIATQKLRALARQQVFVTAFAHEECMMWDRVISPRLPPQFDDDDRPAARVHADFLRDYTLEVFKRTHNYFRGDPLDEIGLAAILKPSNYDTVYLNNGDQLSAKEQASEFRRALRRLFGRRFEYGAFTEDFASNDPLSLDRNLDLSERELVAVHELINLPQFNQMIGDFLKKGHRRFTSLQEHYFKVRFGKLIAFHDAVDFHQIPEHYLRRHREEGVGISERGNPPLQRHPLQALAISPANTDRAIKFGEIALDVLYHAENSGPPYIFLIASEIPDVKARAIGFWYDLDNPGVLRADANNANLYLSLAYSARFRREVSSGRVVMLPVAMEQEGGVITDIPDHSFSVPDNTR